MLQQVDTQLFYWVNRHNNAVLDTLLWTLSQSWSWAVVLGLVLLCFVGGNVRFAGRRAVHRSGAPDTLFDASSATADSRFRLWRAVVVLVLGVVLCFLLSARISVVCFKDVFCRLRPCHALDDVRMYRTSCGGLYGFVSSHAANVFSLALFLSLFYRRLPCSPRRGLVVFLLFAWAFGVGYSRPDLGKHYPGDVLCGALLGLLVGTVVYVGLFFLYRGVFYKHWRRIRS